MIIEDPLWDLMLSTNDCYPGCYCDLDFFDMTSERVHEWVELVGKEKANEAVVQLEELLNVYISSLNPKKLFLITGCYATSQDDALKLLSQWKSTLLINLDDG